MQKYYNFLIFDSVLKPVIFVVQTHATFSKAITFEDNKRIQNMSVFTF